MYKRQRFYIKDLSDKEASINQTKPKFKVIFKLEEGQSDTSNSSIQKTTD